MKPLTSSQRKRLRGLAHDLKPLVHLGKAGLTDAALAQIDKELADHELIKVRFLESGQRGGKGREGRPDRRDPEPPRLRRRRPGRACRHPLPPARRSRQTEGRSGQVGRVALRWNSPAGIIARRKLFVDRNREVAPHDVRPDVSALHRPRSRALALGELQDQVGVQQVLEDPRRHRADRRAGGGAHARQRPGSATSRSFPTRGPSRITTTR